MGRDDKLAREDGDAGVERLGWIAELLRRAEFVDWDRFTVNEFEQGQRVNVYGWIEREEDGYKDFVLVHFWPESETVDFTTSSDEYSVELVEIWFGEEAAEDHNPCHRVEHTFDIKNAVELEVSA